MNIGELKEKVYIISYGNTLTDTGVPIMSETGRLLRWAKVENKTGSMAFQYSQTQFPYDYKITIRHDKNHAVLNTNAVEYKGKKLFIKSVQIVDEGSRRWEVIRCSITE